MNALPTSGQPRLPRVSASAHGVGGTAAPPDAAAGSGGGDGLPARFRSPGGARLGGTASERGFASVIVLILVFVMIALLLGNTRVLDALKQDLQRVEQRQLTRTGDVAEAASTPVPQPVDDPASAGSND